MTLVRWKPTTLDRAFADPFFDRFFNTFRDDRLAGELGEWSPAMDLIEEKDRLVARVELPGVDPKAVEVELQGDMLTIRGERKHTHETNNGGSYLKREQEYGAFMRSVRLPYRIDSEKVKAKSENGVMTITLPKAEEYVGRRIAVEAK